MVYIKESHFHWKFWKPKEGVIGGPVYFGLWHEMTNDRETGEPCPPQTEEQVRVKRSMGMIW